MSETNSTKKEIRELVSISIVPYPDWTGKTGNSDKRFGDGLHKYGITTPIPSNDDEVMELYGISLNDLIAAGVAQKWYGARDVDNVIKEAFDKGKDPNDSDLIETITLAAMEQKFSARERTSAGKEAKALKAQAVADFGSVKEALAAMKEYKALKAAGKI